VSDRRLELPRDEIHLWLAGYDEIDTGRLDGAYRALLNKFETEQQSRFYFERDRRRYLVTRALVRTVLSRYEPIAPNDWLFTNNAYGRPSVANELKDCELFFNVSHTQNLIVLGVAKGRTLGVDVEHIRTRHASIDIARRYFAAVEVQALLETSTDRQLSRFFEYWTLKEAYIKARGMGLSIPLDKFSFSYPNDAAIEFAVHPDLRDDAEHWQFWQLRPGPDHILALCAERIERCESKLIVRKVLPLVREEALELDLVRTSRVRREG
jgi:4'-phosphopantetheinyl transferase